MNDEKDPIFRRVVQVSITGPNSQGQVLLDDGSYLVGLTYVWGEQRGGIHSAEFTLKGEITGMPRS